MGIPPNLLVEHGEQEVFTVAQAATLTGTSVAAIRSRIFRGQLPATKWGRSVFIKRHDLLRVLDLAGSRGDYAA